MEHRPTVNKRIFLKRSKKKEHYTSFTLVHWHYFSHCKEYTSAAIKNYRQGIKENTKSTSTMHLLNLIHVNRAMLKKS